VLLVVLRRSVVDLQEPVDREQRPFPQQEDRGTQRLALLDLVRTDEGGPEEVGESLVEPRGKASEVEVEDQVDVLVVQDVVRVLLPRRVVVREVGTQGDVVLVLAGAKDAGRMGRSFLLPILGQERLEARLVLDGEDDDGPAGIETSPWPHPMEDLTNVLEL